jgi:hypothetical protein
MKRANFRMLLCAAALGASWIAHPAMGAISYVVKADANSMRPLRVTMTLPPYEGVPRKLAVRGAAWGLKDQVQRPMCGSTPLLRDKAVKSNGSTSVWLVPAPCLKVTWQVAPLIARDGATDVSKQQTLRFTRPHWVLFSEPTSLLRLVGDTGTASVKFDTKESAISATRVGENEWRVPAASGAPEFYILGNAAIRAVRVGAPNSSSFNVLYVSDRPDRVERLGVEIQHQRALRYLVEVVPPPQDLQPADLSLLVIWVGMNEKLGQAGGAAGGRSFVANYVVGHARNQPINAARTLMIAAHEQFHQLVDLTRGALPPFPTWLNESLAQYYGLKALAKAMDSPDAKQLQARFINEARPITHGLLELNRRHAANDTGVYSLFYEQGATFWHVVDTALARQTNNGKGLDALLSTLLQSTTNDDGSLPDSFINALRQSIGSEADEILAKYVGQ